MSVAQGHEALDADADPDADRNADRIGDRNADTVTVAVAPAPPAAVVALPARPIALPPRPTGLSPARAWVRALRLPSLPGVLLGGVVGGLLAARTPAGRPGLLALALLSLAAAGALTGLLRDLGDARPGRAGPLRRAEAWRAALAAAAVAAAAVGALAVQRDGLGWTLGTLGALAVLLAVSRRPGAAVCVFTGLLAGGCATALGAWAATGQAGTDVLPVAAAVGAVTAALLVARRTRLGGRPARLLVLAPHVAVGIGVALGTLPLTATAVALALPAARRATIAAGRGDATPVVAGHARLLAVCLLLGLLASAAGLADPVPLPG